MNTTDHKCYALGNCVSWHDGDNDECVLNCATATGLLEYDADSICYSDCWSPGGYYEQTGKCVTSCSIGTPWENTTDHKCYALGDCVTWHDEAND